jgi:hypothetical protein
MTRVIGPTGSRRRRRFLFLPVLMVALTALLFVGGAQGVHALGVFELDGNAINEAAAGDDWDNVCYQVAVDGGATVAAATLKCSTGTGTPTAKATSWTAEPDPSASIFTGGGSKDPIDIGQWAWKDAGGLPDKDNLLHAFAARYNATSSNCGSDVNGNPLTTCDVIYFGSDRFDNSGDAQQGFWFLQNEVTTAGAKSGGGTGFTGSHRNGDILIISDFSNGGTTSTITVYKWNDACKKTGQVLPAPPTGSGNTCGDANLEQLASAADAKCGPDFRADDAFCGIVNPATITMPWAFTDKSATPTNQALNGEFYEAGINLSSPAINLGGECFATVVSETRSSTSTTAVLKDFVTGSFGKCTSSLTSAQNWLPNDSLTSLTITGKSTWSGKLTFTLYPSANCTGVALYSEGGGGSAAPTTTDNINQGTTLPVTTSTPAAQQVTGNADRSWLVFFDSSTNGVPDSSKCETSSLTVNNDVPIGP